MVREDGVFQPFGTVGFVFEQREAEGVEGFALPGGAAGASKRPVGRGEAGEPVEEQGLPADSLALLAKQSQGCLLYTSPSPRD